MSMLDYRVPDLPMPIQQTSTMVCWAFVATMMASWRDRQSWAVPAYIGSLGGPWKGKLDANSGLSAAEAPVLLATMGVQIETTQANFTSERWESMLREWGPIWVTADNNPAAGVQGVHAHILVGIHGPSDGDPRVDVIDPGLGREVSMPMSQFVAKYEQLANTAFAGFQIRHWPARAQQAAQLSASWAQQALERARQMSPAAVAAGVGLVGLLFSTYKEAATSHGLQWEKAGLRGKVVPGDLEAKKHLAEVGPFRKTSFRSLRRLVWDYLVFEDNVGAEFEVTYQYNGTCLAEVHIENISYAPPAPLTGRVLSVDTSVNQSFADEQGDVSAVDVGITYRFQQPSGSAGTYTQHYIIYGDGRTPQFTETRG
ncbi:papain-like cysteine protease family protein [Microbacterium fluvii]|uniref:Papain-like cysteine protease family protein n=2 Tax=Microbacterium fluvii TaxID=415215 RepID=A0ABW2HIP8_9MICO